MVWEREGGRGGGAEDCFKYLLMCVPVCRACTTLDGRVKVRTWFFHLTSQRKHTLRETDWSAAGFIHGLLERREFLSEHRSSHAFSDVVVVIYVVLYFSNFLGILSGQRVWNSTDD